MRAVQHKPEVKPTIKNEPTVQKKRISPNSTHRLRSALGKKGKHPYAVTRLLRAEAFNDPTKEALLQ